MSKKNLDPKQVEEFLLLNPDFLSSNSHILNSIEIVHETGGAVSLIQKQVEMLRRNYESTSSNLLQLLDIAKNNEGIFEKTKKLILELIVCRNLTDVATSVRFRHTINSKINFFVFSKIPSLFFAISSNCNRLLDVDS